MNHEGSFGSNRRVKVGRRQLWSDPSPSWTQQRFLTATDCSRPRDRNLSQNYGREHANVPIDQTMKCACKLHEILRLYTCIMICVRWCGKWSKNIFVCNLETYWLPYLSFITKVKIARLSIPMDPNLPPANLREIKHMMRENHTGNKDGILR